MTFGQRLKYLRLSKKMTGESLGKALSFGKTTISNYENGIRSPDNETLLVIADFFGVSVDYLLGKTDDPRPFPVEDTRTIDEKLQDSDFAYALYEGSKELTDAEKEEILNLFEYVKSKHKR